MLNGLCDDDDDDDHFDRPIYIYLYTQIKSKPNQTNQPYKIWYQKKIEFKLN